MQCCWNKPVFCVSCQNPCTANGSFAFGMAPVCTRPWTQDTEDSKLFWALSGEEGTARKKHHAPTNKITQKASLLRECEKCKLKHFLSHQQDKARMRCDRLIFFFSPDSYFGPYFKIFQSQIRYWKLL